MPPLQQSAHRAVAGRPRKMIFPDFDYINPFTNLPEGEVKVKKDNLSNSLKRSLGGGGDPFGTYQGSFKNNMFGKSSYKGSSPSKSMYHASPKSSGKKKILN